LWESSSLRMARGMEVEVEVKSKIEVVFFFA